MNYLLVEWCVLFCLAEVCNLKNSDYVRWRTFHWIILFYFTLWQNKWTPLHSAASASQSDIMKLLITLGVDTEFRDKVSGVTKCCYLVRCFISVPFHHEYCCNFLGTYVEKWTILGALMVQLQLSCLFIYDTISFVGRIAGCRHCDKWNATSENIWGESHIMSLMCSIFHHRCGWFVIASFTSINCINHTVL